MHVECVYVKYVYRISFDLPISFISENIGGATLFRVGNPKLELKRLPPQMADTKFSRF